MSLEGGRGGEGRGGEGREEGGGRGGMTIIHIILMAPYTVYTDQQCLKNYIYITMTSRIT